jgi:hypothetical protein
MRNKKIGFFLSYVSILLLGCGFLGSFGQSNPLSATNASAPFPDVPLFPGSTADDKVNMIAQMMDPAMIVLFYYTDKPPDEVMAFYTNNLMKEQSWDPQPYDIVKHFSTEGWGPQVPEGTTAGGCEMIPNKQPPQGFCTFVKTDDKGQQVELLIDAGPDDKSDRTRLIYSRMTDVKK